MHLTIGSILSADKLTEAQALLDQLRWQDGAKTAGPVARDVKRNRQADLGSVAGQKLRTLLETALQTHPVFTAAARPCQFSKLLVSETSGGGEYGAHKVCIRQGPDPARPHGVPHATRRHIAQPRRAVL